MIPDRFLNGLFHSSAGQLLVIAASNVKFYKHQASENTREIRMCINLSVLEIWITMLNHHSL